LLYTVPGVPRFGTRKTGEPLGSSPGDILANQIRTLVPPVSQVAPPRERIPSLSVIFRPVLRSDILRGNNPSRLLPDDNLPHLRISLACTTCIAQALCSREIFYHICVHLASVFSKKSYFSFLFSPHGLLAHFLCILHTAFHVFAWKTPPPFRMHRNGALYTKNPLHQGPQALTERVILYFFCFSCSSSPSRGVM